jgi:hypothetical protein
MRILFAIPLLLASMGCEDDPEPTTSTATEASGPTDGVDRPEVPSDPHAGLDNERGAPSNPGAPLVGGIAWEVPAPFQTQTPSSSMRAAEYLFPEEEGERAATMTVFFFGPGQGGSVEANIARWVGQFTLPEGTEPNISRREVNGLPVTVIDVTGSFNGGDMGSPSGAPSTDQRMLAAIVEGPEAPVFFKMIGGTSLMARAETPFTELVESFRPE